MDSRYRLNISASADKIEAAQQVGEYFIKRDFKITDLDLLRPWGFYFYFDPEQTTKFVAEFFAGVDLKGINAALPLQPKVLVFAPGQLNSWQYHHRRAEIWRVITNSLQAIMSQGDSQTPPKRLKFGDVVNFPQGVRHRGGAVADEWGAVVEIWQHSDPKHLSDEEDIVRLEDDYGRS